MYNSFSMLSCIFWLWEKIYIYIYCEDSAYIAQLYSHRNKHLHFRAAPLAFLSPNAPWRQDNISKFCTKSLEKNQITGGEERSRADVGGEMREECGLCVLSVSVLATRPKKKFKRKIFYVISGGFLSDNMFLIGLLILQ